MIIVHELTKVFPGAARARRKRAGVVCPEFNFPSAVCNEPNASHGKLNSGHTTPSTENPWDVRGIVAVDRLSFVAKPGEVYGLMGPNGAGKTTTLRMILGLLRPTSGYAEVDGMRTDRAPDEVKRRIGLVSASAGLYQWLSPREMLLFFADLYGLPRERAERRLRELTDLLELRPFLDQRGGTLSTGQKQRVLLARGLIHDPPIMLLDEPTRGLDVFGSHVVFDYLGHLRDQGKAVILSTHRLHEAENVCDRIGMLHLGRLVMEGTLAELRQQTGRESLAEMFLEFAREEAIGGQRTG